MDGREDGKTRRGPRVAGAVVALAGSLFTAHAGVAEMTNARLRHPAERMAVAHAVDGAVRRLARAECQALLDEFSDLSGRPLRAALDATALDVRAYLDRVLFYDAPAAACEGTTLAGAAAAGNRVIFVCGRRFVRTMAENPQHGEATIIHEMLHSLGLGENPPSSSHITSRVRDLCRL